MRREQLCATYRCVQSYLIGLPMCDEAAWGATPTQRANGAAGAPAGLECAHTSAHVWTPLGRVWGWQLRWRSGREPRALMNSGRGLIVGHGSLKAARSVSRASPGDTGRQVPRGHWKWKASVPCTLITCSRPAARELEFLHHAHSP